MRGLLILLGSILLHDSTGAQDRSIKKVLLIGIDGCRTDALQQAKAPHLQKLIEEGAFSVKNDVLGPRKTGADTVTMPGWTSMLTGVWADKHGIRDNGAFKHSLAPTFFRRLGTGNPRASMTALVSFRTIVEKVFTPAEGAKLVLDGSQTSFPKADQLVAEQGAKILAEQDPTLLFLYFGQVDVAGHTYGFHPKVPEYLRAIALVDEHVGKVTKAISARPKFAEEDWLILVGTDHGGRGTGHAGGQSHEEVRYTFLILHGPSVEKGGIKGGTANVDVVATALTHLGIAINPEWKLDGRCVGLNAK